MDMAETVEYTPSFALLLEEGGIFAENDGRSCPVAAEAFRFTDPADTVVEKIIVCPVAVVFAQYLKLII